MFKEHLIFELKKVSLLGCRHTHTHTHIHAQLYNHPIIWFQTLNCVRWDVMSNWIWCWRHSSSHFQLASSLISFRLLVECLFSMIPIGLWMNCPFIFRHFRCSLWRSLFCMKPQICIEVRCWMRYNDKNMLFSPDLTLVIRNLLIIIFDTCRDFVTVNYIYYSKSIIIVSCYAQNCSQSKPNQVFISFNIPPLMKKNIRIFNFVWLIKWWTQQIECFMIQLFRQHTTRSKRGLKRDGQLFWWRWVLIA